MQNNAAQVFPNYQFIIPVKQPEQVGETEEEEDVPNITSKSNPKTNANSSQEQRTDAELQQLPQGVFPFIAAAAAATKRQRSSLQMSLSGFSFLFFWVSFQEIQLLLFTDG
ncbi:hypothetical protein HPP92_009209 [Vanilla planifolia]|uniref:Uncharacterized protein n=1 Tax=Vanilla planifolia TaxID=51239 RepID=A0A835R9V3_VANPL|nr:hypothetical protein HPP92_009209 [Vanilla planifolia]